MVFGVLNAMCAYAEGVIDENKIMSVSEDISSISTKLVIGTIAVVAIASAVGVLPAVCGTTICMALKVSTVCVITQTIGRFFGDSLLQGEELRKKGSFLASCPLYVVVPIFSFLSEILWRGLAFPVLKGVVSIVSPGPLAITIAAVATSIFEGMNDFSDGDGWDGLGKIAASQLLFFPVYFAGGLTAAILAHAVFNLATSLADRYRFIHLSRTPPFFRAAQAFFFGE